MSVYLSHFRSFSEMLGEFHQREVSWDGNGALPLRKKPLQAAMELFGRRPDLTLGSRVELVRGGLEIGLFRNARDVTIILNAAGQVQISCHRPRSRPDISFSSAMINEQVFQVLEQVQPSHRGFLLLEMEMEGDVRFQKPFHDYQVIRLSGGDGQLLIGRKSIKSGHYAFQDVADLPEDLIQDQILTGNVRLSELVQAYQARQQGVQPVC